MEVSTCVSRHEYLSKHESERQERAHRVRVTQVDLKKGQAPVKHEFNSRVKLSAALSGPNLQASDPDERVYVVEDLSRDVIELLGSAFNVDPHFFRSHVNDHTYNTVTVGAAERKCLDIVSRRQSHFTLRYLRPRYYRNTTSFEKAIREAARFNVLRHVDSDRSRDYLKDQNGAAVTLMRAKTSLWIRPESSKNINVLGIKARVGDVVS